MPQTLLLQKIIGSQEIKMAKKRFEKVPKNVMLNCPNCSGRQRLAVSLESSPQNYICKNCEQEIQTPKTQCCVVCAFSGKRCPYSVKMNAFSKGLELR